MYNTMAFSLSLWRSRGSREPGLDVLMIHQFANKCGPSCSIIYTTLQRTERGLSFPIRPLLIPALIIMRGGSAYYCAEPRASRAPALIAGRDGWGPCCCCLRRRLDVLRPRGTNDGDGGDGDGEGGPLTMTMQQTYRSLGLCQVLPLLCPLYRHEKQTHTSRSARPGDGDAAPVAFAPPQAGLWSVIQ